MTTLAWRCPLCGDPLTALGATAAIAYRALAAWEGCPCTPRTKRRTQTPSPDSCLGKNEQATDQPSGPADAPAPHAVEHQAPAAPDAPAAVPAGGGSGGRALGGMRPGVLLGLVVLGLLAWSPLWLLAAAIAGGGR